jgi:integrase/recombinase XerD
MPRKRTGKSAASLSEPGIRAYLEPHEVESLEKAANNLRDRLLIRLLFHLGCRVSEALAITVDDIDLVRGLVSIQHLKTRLKLSCPNCSTPLGRNHSFCPKCGTRVEKAVAEAKEYHRMRTLPLDNNTLQMLQEYIQRGGPVVRNGKRLIFGINRHRAWQIIRDCAERAGLPKLINSESGKVHGVSPHKLRDAFAVHAMRLDDSGDGLRLLQEHLGHANFNTTAKYRKVSGEEHRQWYQRLWNEGNS